MPAIVLAKKQCDAPASKRFVGEQPDKCPLAHLCTGAVAIADVAVVWLVQNLIPVPRNKVEHFTTIMKLQLYPHHQPAITLLKQILDKSALLQKLWAHRYKGHAVSSERTGNVTH